MNKKLMALAVAGACVAPAAMAQTANPVTLYGRVYVMYESVQAKGGAAPLPTRNRVSDQSSLLGVRGTEDLGGGLKAFFQLETAFNPESNSTTFATRNSGVGLQGGWGSVLIGRWDTPYKILGYGPDLWGDLTIAGITSALHDRGNFDRREQNVIQYWTPNMGGFSARISHAVNEGKTSSLDPSSTSVNVVYGKGPIKVAYAYEEHKENPTATSGYKEEGNQLTGEFTFGGFKIAGIWEEIKKSGTNKQKNWLASLLYTAGKHQLGYQFQQSEGGEATGTTQRECDVNSFGYFYNWSKRSQLVALYTKVDNNSVGVCRFGAGQLGGAGQDPQGFAVGIKHVF
ncbi:MAG: porin [Burkholderiales bacterium]